MAQQAPTLFFHLHLARRAGVVAAVSGGGDSLALLFLLKAHIDLHAPHTRLIAATVDHRLRPASGAEARSVALLCARHGIAHRILEWEGAKPATGVLAAAREARYRLLADAAREAGADLVLTGHTLDDQAETVAMRQARRDGGEGLSGIAPATLFRENVWFCRPLLDRRRQALRDWLSRQGIGWIDDPSNEDPAYERVRVRSRLSGAEIETLARNAGEAGRVREALAGEAGRLIDAFASRPAAGLLRLDPRLLEGAPDAALLALRALLALAGGTPHLPDRVRALALAGRLAGPPMRATLSRAVIDARADAIWIRREARDLPSIALTREPVVWDGRWRLSSTAEAGVSVRPGGRMEEIPGIPRGLLRAAAAAEPGIFIGGEFAGHVVEGVGVSAVPVVAPHEDYLPSFDLALSGALRRLLVLPPLPPLPWKHHIDAEA